MREGILGGSFDPVHCGHLYVARECLRALALDRVLFVPARVPPHKQMVRLSEAQHRLAMARLAIAGEAVFDVSDMELQRTGPSYTIDTILAELTRLGDSAELFLLMGADQAVEVETWRRIKELVRLCQLVPVTREGTSLAGLDRLKGTLPEDAVEAMKSIALRIPTRNIAATEIRRRVRAGLPISEMVPAAVEAYIAEHGLYRD